MTIRLTERLNMGRKPNYSFERMERQKLKASKKASRLEAKKERTEKRKAENTELSDKIDVDRQSPPEVL